METAEAYGQALDTLPFRLRNHVDDGDLQARSLHYRLPCSVMEKEPHSPLYAAHPLVRT